MSPAPASSIHRTAIAIEVNRPYLVNFDFSLGFFPSNAFERKIQSMWSKISRLLTGWVNPLMCSDALANILRENSFWSLRENLIAAN